MAGLTGGELDAVVEAMLATIICEPSPDGPEYDQYVGAQWAGTAFLMECRHDWERLARDESLQDEVRVRAALSARAIREELRP